MLSTYLARRGAGGGGGRWGFHFSSWRVARDDTESGFHVAFLPWMAGWLFFIRAALWERGREIGRGARCSIRVPCNV